MSLVEFHPRERLEKHSRRELFKTTPNFYISAASQDKSKTTSPWKCAKIFTKTIEMSIKFGRPTVLGGWTNTVRTMTSALSRAWKPSCSESVTSQGELLLWFWPQCLNITRYSSVFAHRICLHLKLVVRLVYIFSLFALPVLGPEQISESLWWVFISFAEARRWRQCWRKTLRSS